MIAEGTKIDRYRVERLLGEGGMGAVYAAFDERLERRVALKVVSAAMDLAASERLLREARAAAAFSHPNAIVVHDVSEHDGRLYIAMELLEGDTLLEATRGAGWPTKLRHLVDAARALGAAHAAGIVHRDVKPENVFVTTDGRTKVLDFGIAQRRADAPLTKAGVIIGTPAYMAPEQIRGEALDGRTDQFSWGVTAFEVLAGRSPWGAATDALSLAVRIVAEPVPSLAEVSPALPAAIARIVDRSLSKSPEARFPSMEAIAEALSPFVETTRGRASGRPDLTTGAFAPTVALSAWAAPSRSRARLFLALTLLIAVGVSGIVIARRGGETASPPHGSSRPAASARPLAKPEVTSKSTEAEAAYRRARQLFHDGAIVEGHETADRAARADPGLGAAYVFGLIYEGGDPGKAFRAASALREGLDERSRAVVGVWEPLFASPPRSQDAFERARVLSESSPDDAELALLEAFVHAYGRDLAHAAEHAERAIRIDSTFGGAFNYLANLQRALDDDAAARATLERCVALRHATACITNLGNIHAQEGDCEAFEHAARARAELSPESPNVQLFLISALESRGASMDTLEALFDRADGLGPATAPRPRPWLLEARMRLSSLRGDFSRALTLADELRRLPLDETSMARPSRITWATSECLQETGDAKGSRDALASLLRRVPTFTDVDSADLAQLVAAGFEAGALSRKEAESYDLGVPRDDRNSITVGRACIGLTVANGVEETRAALDVLDRLGNTALIDPVRLARRRALVGQDEEAMRALRPLAHTCHALASPFASLRAAELLGSILEKRGDTPSACEEYARVLARWGNAKPRSVTADRARARALALRCAATTKK